MSIGWAVKTTPNHLAQGTELTGMKRIKVKFDFDYWRRSRPVLSQENVIHQSHNVPSVPDHAKPLASQPEGDTKHKQLHSGDYAIAHGVFFRAYRPITMHIEKKCAINEHSGIL